jgi:hypothetical protein
MNFLSDMLERIRRNHAVEHATVHVLVEMRPRLRLTGRSTPWGFYVYGAVDTVELANAAEKAISRLRAGEINLAVHPACGTNLAVAGIMAGLASFVALRGRSRFKRLPQAMAASTLAVLLAQPTGLWVQEKLTTSVDLGGVQIRGVDRRDKGRGVGVHFVRLDYDRE